MSNIAQSNQPAVESANRPLMTAGDPGSSLALDQWRGFALILVLIGHAFHESAGLMVWAAWE